MRRQTTLLGLEGKRGKGGDGASPPEGAELDGGTIRIVAVLALAVLALALAILTLALALAVLTLAILALALARFLGIIARIGGGRVGSAGLGLLGILSLLGVGGAVGLASRGLIVSCGGALLVITLACLNGGADLPGDI